MKNENEKCHNIPIKLDAAEYRLANKMSERTCPADTLANNRKPNEKDLNPIEIHSSKIDGTSRLKLATSMQSCNCKFTFVVACTIISISLKIRQLNNSVLTISVTYVAVVTLRLKPKAKNRYIPSTENNICNIADLREI